MLKAGIQVCLCRQVKSVFRCGQFYLTETKNIENVVKM